MKESSGTSGLARPLEALAAVTAIAALAAAASAVPGVREAIAIGVPYAAFAALALGLCWRVVRWSLVPVPFHIPTVCGQQKSLPWIRSSRLESPDTAAGVAGRMALEVFAFRSLFRHTESRLESGPRLIYREARWLWLAAIAFHWSMLVILVRHLRLFVDPPPAPAVWLDRLDGFFQVGAPVFYLSDGLILLALLYLFQRRLRRPLVRYISLFTDYFALCLLLGIAVTGIWMRYIARTDVVAVKQFAISLTVFAPVVPKSAGAWFYAHLALVSTLAAWLPFSKLMHLGGVFLSPTRNLANDSRMRRHVNPWNYPVKVHTYEEWEQEFHDKIAAAGLPLEKR
ncbi:MAG TPA: sulfate reduction electron transfer complex DsrMKJOP subunit DsrM [Bryobacteraceae bacterium]|nr:sulfate reduction electron transfer complex DsrMKJOP subunit DsrM [Bryobacteraceae bacterium]